jgi:putative phosphoesterase
MAEGDDQRDGRAPMVGDGGKVRDAGGKPKDGVGKAKDAGGKPKDGVGKARDAGGKVKDGGASGADEGRRSRPAQPAGAPAAVGRKRPVGPRIGVISDTHGYLDPVVAELFGGVTHIIHAGDIGDPAILEALEAIAPVTAVLGNVEGDDLVSVLPREVTGEIAGVRFVVAHKPRRLLKRLAAGRIVIGPDDSPPDLVVFGHVHVPSATWIDGALYLNPGTASSPDEEDDGPTVVIVEVEPTGLSARFVPLRRRLADDGAPLVTRTR